MTAEHALARLHSIPALPASADDDSQLREVLRTANAKIAHLEIAVDHRTVIGQAVGILMERYHLDAKTAFDALRQTSSHANRKIFDIACELSETGRSEDL